MSEVITVDRLVAWSRQICGVETPDPTQVAHELGLSGTLVPSGRGLALEPPLPGTRRIRLLGDDGVFESLQVEFDETTSLTREGIEASFGTGQSLPRVHWESAHQLVYDVYDLDGRRSCELFAEFAVEPAGDTPAIGVMVRRLPTNWVKA